MRKWEECLVTTLSPGKTDFSVFLAIGFCNELSEGPYFYVIEILKEQVFVPYFAQLCNPKQLEWQESTIKSEGKSEPESSTTSAVRHLTLKDSLTSEAFSSLWGLRGHGHFPLQNTLHPCSVQV